MHEKVRYVMSVLFGNCLKFPGNMPVSIHRTLLRTTLPFGYVAAIKADGERIWLFVYPTYVLLLNRAMQATVIAGVFSDVVHFHVFDAERLGARILLFDTLIYDGFRTLMYGYLQRYEYTKLFCAACTDHIRIPETVVPVPSRVPYVPVRTVAGLYLEPKSVYTLDKLPALVAMPTRFPCDGLIFMQLNHQYAPFRSHPHSVLKYKARKDITVDFCIQNDALQVVAAHGALSTFALLPFPQVEKNGQIWECAFEQNVWTCLKHRTDKQVPNSLETATATVQNMCENITLAELVELAAGSPTRKHVTSS